MVPVAECSRHLLVMLYAIVPPRRGDPAKVFDHAEQGKKAPHNHDGIGHAAYLASLPYSVDHDEIEDDVICKFHNGMKARIHIDGREGRDNRKNKKRDQREIERCLSPLESRIMDDPQEIRGEHDQGDEMGDRYGPCLERAAGKRSEDQQGDKGWFDYAI